MHNKGTGSKIRLPAAVTEGWRAGWGSCEGSVRFAAILSFLPLFSTQDIVPQCHGGGESQTGCFCCMILAVTHKQAKRSKPPQSCPAPPLNLRSKLEGYRAQSPATVTISKRSVVLFWSFKGALFLQWHQNQFLKIWLHKTLHLKNYFLLTCPGMGFCFL